MWSKSLPDRIVRSCTCPARNTLIPLGDRPRYSVAINDRLTRSHSTRDKSFQGQLYDSTQQRVVREKAEQARFAEIRETRKAARGSGAWVPPFVLIVGLFIGWRLGASKPDTESTASTSPLGSISRVRHNVAIKTLQAAWIDFRDIVGADNIVDGRPARSGGGGGGGDGPFCVLRPATTEEVGRIMRVCHQRRIPVVTGPGLKVPVRGGDVSKTIKIDFGRMSGCSTLDDQLIVQRGADDERLRSHGLSGSLGHHRAHRTRPHDFWDAVVDLKVVLADGTIVHSRRPADVTMGYDITRLFESDEDTLGIWTEATLDSRSVKTAFGAGGFRSATGASSGDNAHTSARVLADAPRVELSRKMKMAFDPLCLLNCNKVVQVYAEADTDGPLVLPGLPAFSASSPGSGRPVTQDEK